jgi:2-hydroxychromene-2-carboxylate isomerase
MADIEFYYDFGSPNAYFVHKVLPGIAKQSGRTLVYRPILLGGVFKATNNQPPMMAFKDVDHKLDYMRVEIARFVKRHAVPFQFNPHFPVMTIATMRGAVFAQGKPWEKSYIETVFDAVWVQGKKMDDPEVIGPVLGAAGLPVDEIFAATQDPGIKSELANLTAAAVARKVYGSPTMFVGDEMFFGKDSIDDLKWYLEQPAFA